VADFAEEFAASRRATSEPQPAGFGAEFAQFRQQQREEQGRFAASVMTATETTPEKAAQQRYLSTTTGVPIDVVKTAEGQVKAMAKLRELQQAAATSPVLRDRLANPDFAALAQNDAKPLSSVETLVRSLGGGAVGDVLGRGLEGISQGLDIGARAIDRPVRQLFGDKVADAFWYTPQRPGGVFIDPLDALRATSGELRRVGKALQPTDPNFITDVFSGLGQITAQVGLMLNPVTRAASVPMLFGQGVSVMSEKTQNDDASQAAKDTAALLGATWTGLTEKYGLDKIVGPLAVPVKNALGAALARIGYAGAIEGTQEFAENIGQDAVRKLLTNEQATLDIAGAGYEGGVGATVGAVFRTLIEGAIHARARGRQREIERTQADISQLQNLLNAASGSQVFALDKSTLADFVQASAERAKAENGNTPTSVFIDGRVLADTLAQSGMSEEQIAATLPSVLPQLADAARTNSEVEIPIGELTAALPGSPLEQALLPNLRMRSQDMSLNEAKDAQKKAQEFIEQSADRIIQQSADQVQAAASMEGVRQRIKADLDATGRFSKDVNDKGARLVAQFYTVMGERMGMAPEKLYDSLLQYRVQSEGRGTREAMGQGDRFDLSQPADGNQLRDYKIGDTTITLDANANSGEIKIASLRTPQKKRGQGSARTAMQALIEQADRQGVALKLDASALDKKTSAAKLVSFYQSLGFEPTGRKINAVGDIEMVRYPADQLNQPFNGPETATTPLGDATEIEVDGVTRPALNSEGRPIHWSQEGVRNFWRWFGDSKVVDEQGRPLVVYHGTTADVEKFVLAYSGSDGVGYDVPAIFATTDKNLASDYALNKFDRKIADAMREMQRFKNENPGVYNDEYESRLQAVKSAFADQRSDGRAEIGGGANVMPLYMRGDLVEVDANGQRFMAVMPKVLPDAMAKGKDGAIVNNVIDNASPSTDYPASVFVTFSPENIKSATGNRGTFDGREADILKQSAFHGSPFRGIEKFSTDFIGTGEGAQAYGWGLYFASRREIGDWYRRTLSERMVSDPDFWAKVELPPALSRAEMEELDSIYAVLNKNRYGNGRTLNDAESARFRELRAKEGARTDAINAARPQGQVYEVDIPEDSEMLDWDKPLSEQPEGVRKILDGLVNEAGDPYNLVRYFNPKNPNGGPLGQEVYRALSEKFGSDKAASEALAAAGIKGIKYLDGGSRTAGDGSHNYVVFSGDDVAIRDQFYQPAQAGARGSYDIASMTTVLNGTADLSTFLHESGHFFLDALRRMVASGQATPEVQSMYDAALKGLKVKPEDWEAWHAEYDATGKIPDGLRAAHEKWAETFEAYLFTGKAPNVEMRSLFRTFMSWLKRVYVSIEDFARRTGTTLDPELKAVMDRMLATDQEIAEAEQVAGLLPDFEASAEAMEKLNARSLRDLQWVTGAKNRALRALQKEAAALRREVRIDARREIMSQPVYRAWAFLTGKMADEDRIPSNEPGKSDPSEVDPSIDSLFVAIGKLGGLNKAAVISEWGTDPADRPQSGVFGKPLWRREGGVDLDRMAQTLASFGYLRLDANGKAEIRDFEDAFADELRGEKVFSVFYDYSRDQMGDLKAGENADIRPLGAGRLDLDELSMGVYGLSKDVIDRLVARRMTSKKGGINLDIVADLFGFRSGVDMANALANAEFPTYAVEGMTDQRMLERHGDLATPEAIERAALEAVHNQARAKSLATELAAQADLLSERTETGRVDAAGRPITVNTLMEAARQFAENVIGRRRVGELKKATWMHVQAERRAGRDWTAATRKGDTRAAVQAKQDQVLNNAAARAGMAAQEQVRKALDFFRRVTRGTDEKLVERGYDPDIANAARAILAAYGIAPSKGEPAVAYLETLQRSDPATFNAVAPSVNAALLNAKPFEDLTFAEMQDLVADIDALWHLAKRSRQMEVDGDLLDRQDVQNDLKAEMEERGIPDTMPGDTSAITPAEQGIRKILTFVAAAKRIENWAQNMGSTFTRYVFQPVKEAADRYRADKTKYLKRYRELLTTIERTLRRELIDAPELGYTFGKDTGGIAMQEILHALLHTGNSSNQRKLLLGRGWATENEDGTLDTSRWEAFVQRMIDEGRLTKTHFDFVQSVWDLLEDLKPGAQKTHRDVFGRYFAEVTADAFNTPFGVYRGGYVPAIADGRIVSDKATRDLAEAENESMAYAFPATNRGFTKSRVDYNRPLLLDLRLLAQHIDKVLLFTHLEQPVRDVRRVLTAKEVAYGLNRIDPVAFDNVLTPWLNRASRQSVETPVAGDAGLMRLLSGARNRAGLAAMFANVANAAQQLTGFSIAAVRVKPTHLIAAAAQMTASPREMKKAVADASVYMRERMENETSNAERAIQEILLKPSVYESAKNWSSKHAYFLQQAVDNVMGPIIWTAAFNQSVAQGKSEKDAVRFADSVIRTTQGSTLPEDVSRIETGNAFVRLFTQFASYFNMQANLIGTEFAQTARELGVRKGAGRMLYITTLGFLAPAIVAEAIMQGFRGGPDDEDKDGEYLDDWLAATLVYGPLRNATAMVPVLGQGINAVVNASNSKPYDDRIATSPAISMIESSARAPQSVYNAIVEDGSQQKAVRDVATLLTMLTGIPFTAAARPLGYAAGMDDFRIRPTDEVDMARGLITGVASPQSK
jgi:hypothetical protein